MSLIKQALHLYQEVTVNLKESKSKWLNTRRNLAQLHTVTSSLLTEKLICLLLPLMIIKMSFTQSKVDVRIYVVLMMAIKNKKNHFREKSDQNCYEFPITSGLLIKIITLAISTSEPEASEVLTKPLVKGNRL